ncbi:hypothetical protein BGZ94_008555 [Podila epigama]|nr:hypothetical protein BGZ94_008555 [Podila epigama]
MEDLLGLSYDPKTANSNGGAAGLGQGFGARLDGQQQRPQGAAGVALPGMAQGSGKVKPPAPPVTSKPTHLQLNVSKPASGAHSVYSTSQSSSTLGSFNNNSSSSSPAFSQQPLVPTAYSTISPAALVSSTGAPAAKKADDAFSALMSSFGYSVSSTDSASKNRNAMSLDERKRHDQQQQFLGSFSNSPTNSSPLSRSLGSMSGTGTPTPTPAPAPRGFDPNQLLGSASGSMPAATVTGSPRNPQGFASPKPSTFQQPVMTPNRNQSPSGFLASPGSMGRSISPSMVPLQPERSNNASPAQTLSTTNKPQDPFGALLGNQVSRNSPAAKNQSLNAIRNNTPPIRQAASNPTAMAADPWDLDFLAKATATKQAQSNAPKSDDLFDLGSFERALPDIAPRQRDSVDALNSFVGKQPSPMSSPKPSPPPSKPAAKPPRSAHSTKASTEEDARIAQIVSMGFSAERAKLALSMTENGRDIEAAIEYLVQNDEAEDERRRQQQQQDQRRGNTRRPQSGDSDRRRGNTRYMDSDDGEEDDPPLANYRRRQQREQQEERQRQQQQQELSRAQMLQQQKDKLVGTASLFGMSVLSKANDLYKQGREKVQAVMEDMSAEDPRTANTAARRHEWIDDEPSSRTSRNGISSGGYKDSDSEDEVYKGRRSNKSYGQQQERPRQESRYDSTSSSQSPSQRDRKEKENFENTYVSASRRGGAGQSNVSSSSKKNPQQPLFSLDDSPPSSAASNSKKQPPVGSLLSSSSSRQQQQQQQQQQKAQTRTASSSQPSPRPTRPPRVLVQASSQQLAESNHYKEKGNEFFKLGQFGQAAELYQRAGQVLPSGHILLIVTLNNRAAALLKVGEYRQVVGDCDQSIQLIQGPDGQGVHDTLPPSAGVNLKDQLGKALMRRATAYENLEKYQEAKDDWARLRDVDPTHKNAVEGHRRCERALALVKSGAADKAVAASPVLSRSSPQQQTMGGTAAVRSSPMQDLFAAQSQSNQSAKAKVELARSEGVSRLRQNAAQQEREDDEKLRLRDQVDMKLTLWKAGKEDNIRALIASLGTVLWPSVGWKPVGMHELVTPSQVKIKYMRAIGKMHPDKLVASTTVEQRMMANTIFSTLNSAWDAFKAQNNM